MVKGLRWFPLNNAVSTATRTRERGAAAMSTDVPHVCLTILRRASPSPCGSASRSASQVKIEIFDSNFTWELGLVSCSFLTVTYKVWFSS